MFIDALAGLNYLLKQRGSNMTVVAFIIMPAPTNNFNVESLKGTVARAAGCFTDQRAVWLKECLN